MPVASIKMLFISGDELYILIYLTFFNNLDKKLILTSLLLFITIPTISFERSKSNCSAIAFAEREGRKFKIDL